MQKIMFEHRRFGLEQAVIARLKENTRRRVRFPKGVNDEDVESAVMGIDKKGRVYFTFSVATHQGTEAVDVYPKYQIGEHVAVAQSYKTIYDTMEEQLGNCEANEWWCKAYDVIGNQFGPATTPGYNNKLFVRADLMPHVIEITDIKAERLQGISNEDCLREGIKKMEEGVPYRFDENGKIHLSADPRMLFADLIDLLNGCGTWQRNEWQFAYTFKLIKQYEDDLYQRSYHGPFDRPAS